MYLLWVVLFFIQIFFQISVYGDLEKLHGIAADCIETSHVDPDDLGNALVGNVKESDEFKNFLLCFFNAVGFLHDDEIDYEAIILHLEYLEPVFPTVEDLHASLITCKEKLVHHGNIADTIFVGFKCLVGA